MPNLQQFALGLIANNPQIQKRAAGNPMLQKGLQAIQNGDTQAGQQLASNICKSMGVTPQDGYNQAMGYFGGMRR